MWNFSSSEPKSAQSSWTHGKFDAGLNWVRKLTFSLTFPFMFLPQAMRLSSRDYGKDLPGVEALLRKHDDLERDLTVIEDQMEILESEAHRLVRSQPHMAQTVQVEQANIIESWERLNDLFDGR